MGIDDMYRYIVPIMPSHCDIYKKFQKYHHCCCCTTTKRKKMAIIVRLKFKEILPLSLAAVHSETKGSKNVHK